MSADLQNLAEQAVSRLLTVVQAENVPPVDVRELAFKAGVDAVYIAGDLIGDGRLEVQGDRTVIALTPRAGGARQRYTIAHELGHFWLRRHDHRLLQSLTPGDEERFCNLFAAALLLPPAWVDEHGSAHPPTLEGLREIASLADVSLVACFISLRRLPQWRRSLLLWRRFDGEWRLNSVVGVADQVRGELRASAQTGRAISVVARMPNGEATCNLPLELGGVAITTRAQVAVTCDGAIGIMDLPRPVDKSDRARRQPEPRALLAFALARGPGSECPAA
jgi:hypothetical protein